MSQLKPQAQSVAAFIWLQLSSITGVLGGSMVFMLLPWTALSIAQSSALAGLVISISNIPGLLLSPLMGSFIDRVGRRRSAVLLQFTPLIVDIGFPVAYLMGWMNLGTLILLGLLRGLLGNGSMSARKSLVPDAIKGTKITMERANGLHESVAAAGFALGPVLAATLIHFLGNYNTFYVVAAIEALSGFIAMGMRVDDSNEPEAEDPEAKHWLHYVTAGFKVLGRVPSVMILMATFTMLATIYLPTEMVLLPRYYTSIHQPESMGFILFIMAAFTMIGTLGFEKLAKHFSFSTLMRSAVLGVGVAMIPMSFLPPNWVMFSAGALLGFAWGPLPPLINIIVQRKIPASQRGRVFSLEQTIWTGGPMISMSLVGAAVDGVGVRVVYPIITFVVLALGIWLTTRSAVKDLNTAEFVDM